MARAICRRSGWSPWCDWANRGLCPSTKRSYPRRRGRINADDSSERLAEGVPGASGIRDRDGDLALGGRESDAIGLHRADLEGVDAGLLGAAQDLLDGPLLDREHQAPGALAEQAALSRAAPQFDQRVEIRADADPGGDRHLGEAAGQPAVAGVVRRGDRALADQLPGEGERLRHAADLGLREPRVEL